MNVRRALLVFVLCASAFCTVPHYTHAQGAGIKIVPAQIEKSAKPGDVIKDEVVITNVSNQDKTFFIFTKNIKGVEGNGTPVFEREGEPSTGFEMSDWMSFQSDSIDVPAGGDYHLPITITVPADASPGSHFGGIFVSAEPPKLREIGAGVGYEVASIVSIRIAGDVIDNARIRSFSTNKLFFGSKNVDFDINIENQGNILIRPYGPLTITNMFGKQTANFTVNDSLAGVFPGTMRDLKTSWTDDSLGFGQYKAVVALVYDGNGGQKTIDAALTFWIFPMKIIVPTLIALVVIVGLGYVFVRMYINRAIAQSAGSRRIVSGRYRRRTGISRLAFVFIVLMAVVTIFLIALLILFA